MQKLCVAVLLLALAACAGSAPNAAESAARRPNIVFVMADDMGWDVWPKRDGASHPLDDGHSLSRLLPNIDRWMGAEGLFLSRHYAASTCSPSRQSLLSGRQPHRVNHNNKACDGLPVQMPTLATRLKQVGYRTALG